MRAAADARQMLELLQHERADATAVIVGVRRQLLDEQRPHAALLEVPHVDPAVVAAGVGCALGVAHDLVADLEEELVDVVLAVDLDEATLGERALVFDGLAVDVAEAELQELPGPVQVAPVDAAHADLQGGLVEIGPWRRHGSGCSIPHSAAPRAGATGRRAAPPGGAAPARAASAPRGSPPRGSRRWGAPPAPRSAPPPHPPRP